MTAIIVIVIIAVVAVAACSPTAPRRGAASNARARPRAPEHRGPRHRQQLEANAARASETTQEAEQRFERADAHRTEAERLERQAADHQRLAGEEETPPRSSRRARRAPARPPRATTSAPPRRRIASSSCRAVGPAVHGRYRNRGHPSLRARLGPFACPRRHRRPADGPRRAHLPHRPAPGRRGGPRVRAALLALLRPVAQGRGLLHDGRPDRHGLRQRRPAGQARQPPDRRAAAARRWATCGATSPRAPAARRARPPSARRGGDESRRRRRARAHALRARRRHRARHRPRRGRRHRDHPALRALGRQRPPGERSGEEISLLARMACLSQTMESSGSRRGRRLRRRLRPARHLVRPDPRRRRG